MIDWLHHSRLLAALLAEAEAPDAVARVRALEAAAPRFRNIAYPFTPMPLLVEPAARGLGVGERLVTACTAFAQEAGYHTITLWTVASLLAARRLYERAGYRLVAVEPEFAYGQDLINETWELRLTKRG